MKKILIVEDEEDVLELVRYNLEKNGYQAERKKYYHRMQEILAEEQPYTFLYVPDALPIVSSRFRGIEPSAIGIGYNFIEWYAPKDEQRYVMTK